MRQALDLAFDFEWANRNLFHGLYERTTSFFENSPMKASGEPAEAEKTPGTALAFPHRKGARPRLSPAEERRLGPGPEPPA